MKLHERGAALDFNLRQGADISSSLDTVVPPPMEINTVHTGPAGNRQHIKITAEGTDTYGTNNNIIRFKPSSVNFLDFRRGTLTFFASATGSGGTYLRFANGIWNIIEKEIIFWNGRAVSTNIEKNMYRSLNFTFNRDITVDNIWGEIWGIGNKVDRESWVTGKVYDIPLNLPMLEQEEIPAWKCKDFAIEFTLAPANRVLETDHLTYSYTITAPGLRVEEVEYQESWRRYIDTQTLYWAHPKYSVYTFNNQSARFQGQVAHRTQGVERMIAVIKHTNDITDPTVDDRFYTFNYDNCKDYYVKIDNEFYPRQPVKASNTGIGDTDKYYEAFYHMMWNAQRSFLNDSLTDKYRTNLDSPYNNFANCPVNCNQFVTDKFCMSLDFMTFLYNSNDFISKQDWSKNNIKVILNINFNSPPLNDQTIYVFVIHKALFVLPPDGKGFIIE